MCVVCVCVLYWWEKSLWLKRPWSASPYPQARTPKEARTTASDVMEMPSGKGALQNRLFYEPIIVRSNTQSCKHTHPHTRTYTHNENGITGHANVGPNALGLKGRSEEHNWDGEDRERQMERLGRVSVFLFSGAFSECITIQVLHDSTLETHFIYTNLFLFYFLPHTHMLGLQVLWGLSIDKTVYSVP